MKLFRVSRQRILKNNFCLIMFITCYVMLHKIDFLRNKILSMCTSFIRVLLLATVLSEVFKNYSSQWKSSTLAGIY